MLVAVYGKYVLQQIQTKFNGFSYKPMFYETWTKLASNHVNFSIRILNDTSDNVS